jgi:hypothetical protein
MNSLMFHELRCELIHKRRSILAFRRDDGLTIERIDWVCQRNTADEIVSPTRMELRPGAAIQMTLNLPETTSKMEGPLVKQFSVFLPNKVGAMLEMVKLLNMQNTHVVALSVSESTDSAIARIIASDPALVEKLFREKNVPFGISQVVVVEMREVATQLVKLLAALVMAEVNVHFAYPLLIRPRGFAAIALHVDDTECASSVLMGEGFKLLSQDDITR